MATENQEQVQQRTKKYASEVERELKALRSEGGPKAWREAELIYAADDQKLWAILGYETMRGFYESLYIGRSTWYSRLRYFGWAKIALDREAITRARLNRMPMQNVKQLLRLDDRRRFDQRWIEKALTMTESDFEAAVDAVLEGAEEDDSNQPESRTLLKVPCTVSQKTFYLEAFSIFAKRQDPPLELDDEAHILELCLADVVAASDAAMSADIRAWIDAGRPNAETVAAGGGGFPSEKSSKKCLNEAALPTAAQSTVSQVWGPGRCPLRFWQDGSNLVSPAA